METYLIIGLVVLAVTNFVTYRKLQSSRGYRRMEKRRLDFTLGFLNNSITKEIANAVDLNFLSDNKILPQILSHYEKIFRDGEPKEIGKRLSFINSLNEEKKNFFLHQMKFVAGTTGPRELAKLFINTRFIWHVNNHATPKLVTDFILSVIEGSRVTNKNRTIKEDFILACEDEVVQNVPKNEEMLPDAKILLQADIIHLKKKFEIKN